MLYVNADDFGWTEEITDRILACYRQRRVHAASAMTFMKDSERSADLARENGFPTGLHLNFTQDFTSGTVNAHLRNKHRSVATYLKARKLNQTLFNPLLCKAFDYVFQAQWDEFFRLYGREPARLDGHHHMHLCMNMLASGKLPRGLKVRRSFTFRPGEKNPLNRLYRYLVDRWLKSRFQCTDYFFSIVPISFHRIKRIILLSRSADVELMVHPGVKEEHNFLSGSEWAGLLCH
jgi:chitin disaccharide deacetylase